MHPQRTAYSAAPGAKPGRWCWTCTNTGYRPGAYRGAEIIASAPCICHLGTLAHVRDKLKNLTPRTVPNLVSPEEVRAEQRRAALIAQGYRSPAFDRTQLAENAAL